MQNYIDGFVFPIQRDHLETYQNAAEAIAKIWKENGALAYHEYVGDDLSLEGTRTFTECVNAKDGDAIIFGWVVFDSKVSHDLANKRVAKDPRMKDLIGPLTDPNRLIFDAARMAYGGFRPFIQL